MTIPILILTFFLLVGVASSDVVSELVSNRKTQLQQVVAKADQDIAAYQTEIEKLQAQKAKAILDAEEFNKVDITVKAKGVIVDEGVYVSPR
jgi:cytochrome c-type biogenesis protein CcmH/NrfG